MSTADDELQHQQRLLPGLEARGSRQRRTIHTKGPIFVNSMACVSALLSIRATVLDYGMSRRGTRKRPVDDARKKTLDEHVDSLRRRRVNGIMSARDCPPDLSCDLFRRIHAHFCLGNQTSKRVRRIGSSGARRGIGHANSFPLPFPAKRNRKTPQREFSCRIAGEVWIPDVAENRADI